MIRVRLKNTINNFVYQWDTNQFLVLNGIKELTYLFLAYEGEDKGIRIGPFTDSESFARIPDSLLQEEKTICVYIVETFDSSNTTRLVWSFPVKFRPKPDDYVYDEKETITWEALEGRVFDLERKYFPLDDTLSVSGAAADARKVQEALNTKQPKGNYALKDEIPIVLPNPFPLFFTGKEKYKYDGTQEVEITLSQIAGASDWADLENKPFDELNPNEMEVIGLEPNRQLGVKEIAQSKVNGLEAKFTEIDQALQGKQPSGDYATKTELSQGLNTKQPKGDYALKNEIPTKVSDLDNDSKFVNETQLSEVDTKVKANTTAIGENTTAIGLKADKTEIPTKVGQLENDASYVTTSELTTGLGKKLDLAGGKMQGKIDMASFGIANLPDAVANGEPVTFKQLNDAISGLGTVFNLKGSKPTFDALPKDSNKIGDVWFVEDESVGYIWIEKNGVPQWEKFGPAIDLSGYLTKAGLLTTTGSATDNTMSQDAITKALNEKQPSGDYATNKQLAEGLAGKQDAGDYATKTELQEGLDAKQPTGDYATNTDLANKFNKAGHTPNKNLVTDSSGNVAEADFEKPYKIVPSEQEVPYDEEHIIYREEDATGGGVDISLGMTGASVGQIVTVGSVDASGKPTGYTPVTANEWNWGSY